MSTAEEVEGIVESGSISSLASREALVYMAERWLAGEVRRRTRRLERKAEEENRASQAIARQNTARAKVAQLTADIVAQTVRAWGDLLDVEFALPDGTHVTWRTATLAQHQQRAEMLERMANANGQTASLHRAAIKDIQAAGVNTLGDV